MISVDYIKKILKNTETSSPGANFYIDQYAEDIASFFQDASPIQFDQEALSVDIVQKGLIPIIIRGTEERFNLRLLTRGNQFAIFGTGPESAVSFVGQKDRNVMDAKVQLKGGMIRTYREYTTQVNASFYDQSKIALIRAMREAGEDPLTVITPTVSLNTTIHNEPMSTLYYQAVKRFFSEQAIR